MGATGDSDRRNVSCLAGDGETGCGLVYLATPYSDPDAEVRERRYREVNRVAADLMRDGLHVFSPISHTHAIAAAGDLPKGWEFWQAYDRAVLATCRKVIVLMQEGWRESKGVQAEIEIAREMGLPVEFIDSNAHPHGRAVASKVRRIVGSLDSGHE